MRYILPILLLTAACSGDPDTFDTSDLTPGQQLAAQQAADIWCESYPSRCLRTGADGGSRIETRTDMRPEQVGRWVALPTLDCADCASIQILAGLDDVTFGRIVLHELGHHLGCESESLVPGDVMYYRTSGAGKYPTANDLECVQ